MAEKYQAPSVKKAFQILKLISNADNGIGISELSKNLRIGKSTVHGITIALEEIGAISRDPVSKKFTLGLTLFELGRSAYSHIDLKEISNPIMHDLMEKTQESVFLGVLNGEHVTIINIVESRKDIKITSPIGTTIPILAGAVGKVFLASMDEEQATRIIKSRGLTKFTRNTGTDFNEYMDELKAVKNNGYAIDDEGYILGVWAVASPINTESHMMSAIWSVGFKAGLDSGRMNHLAEETKQAAGKIHKQITLTQG